MVTWFSVPSWLDGECSSKKLGHGVGNFHQHVVCRVVSSLIPQVGSLLTLPPLNLWAYIADIFTSINSALGQKGSLGLFAGLNVVAYVMVFLFVEETKQRSLEELDHIFAVSKREFIRFKVSSYLPWVIRKYVFGLERPKPELYRDLVWGSQANDVVRPPIKPSYHPEHDQTGLRSRPTPVVEQPRFSDTGLPDVAEME